ncbi:MAG: transposase like protein [Candidatus Doudnabacteria bacterium]|nr:transposase like protein [Candidatus Doudnabacteria bacterium]
MNRTRVSAPDTIYHVYNRGNKKDILYYDNQDFKYFLDALVKYAEETGFTIYCYCLMTNHFHFCCKQNTETSLAKLMLKLNTSYAMYFNQKYKQVGHIFQGRFKAKVVDSDAYLAYLSMYIHANPVDLGVTTLHEYKYSSYNEYYDCEERICDHKPVLAQFNDSYLEYFVYGHKFKEDRLNHLSYKNGTENSPFEKPSDQT